MTARRVLGPLVLLVLIAAVGAALWVSFRDASTTRARSAVRIVSGLIGSEKESYLRDPRVLDELRKNGFDLRVETSGSRAMTTRSDIKNYDFAFPAGAPAGQRLKAETGAREIYTPFYTPMTIASWKPIVDILAKSGAIGHDNGRTTVDTAKLLALVRSGKRWNELPGSGAYAVNKSVLISSTDARSSNSGAMYLSLASYIFNNNRVVEDRSQAAAVQGAIDELFTRQGYQESSSAGPFEDYVQIGIGKAPLVICYESQFIERMLEPKNRDPQMVLLYPKPTIYTKHTFVPVTENGDRLGRLLTTDPVLQHLAVEHGFRIEDAAYARDTWKRAGLDVPDRLIDVVDPPSYDFLELLITGLERAYK